MSKNKPQDDKREKLALVFIDTTIPDHQQRLDAVRASDKTRTFEVIVIDRSDDGVVIISSSLSRYQNIDAIHIVSRGTDSSLMLGSTPVDQHYLNKFSGIFSSWSDAFSASARIHLYGCGITSSVSGQSFVRTLARLTSTVVTTSEDATGQVSLGADWSVEYQNAAIEKSLATSDLEPS